MNLWILVSECCRSNMLIGNRLSGIARITFKLTNSAALPFDLAEFTYHDSGMTTNEMLKKIGL